MRDARNELRWIFCPVCGGKTRVKVSNAIKLTNKFQKKEKKPLTKAKKCAARP